MPPRQSRRKRPPLDAGRLNELALAYVGRFATTRSKLASYLGRKLRERGWAGDRQPELDGIVERLAGLGYVDDAAYALSKSRSLSGRGYGPRRVRQSLHAAGVGEEDALAARELAEAEKVQSALRFAKRRRLGPFGAGAGDQADRAGRDKALAAMIRAGHGFQLSKAILSLDCEASVDIEFLSEKA
ncbi:MAG: RecX family transcriptional regulator [Sphingomonas sp.]|nr:RecX family transcriptional regulator [Sphingomonas sp.]